MQKPESSVGPQALAPAVPQDVVQRSQRERILAAMAASCAEKTFAATTIADIVERGSISRATFYKHFANKRECVEAAIAAFVEELEAAMVAASTAGDSRPVAVRMAVAAMLERLAAKLDQAKLVLLDAPILDPAIVAWHRDRVVAGLEAQWHAGKGGRHSKADARIAIGRAHVLIADYLAAGRADELPELIPELVYITLLPFVGHEEALAQDKLSR